MLEVESQDSQELQRNATGFMFLYFFWHTCSSFGGQILYSQVLFCWLGKGGQLGSWDFRPADFVDDVVMSTFPPSTPSGFLFIIRTST